MTLLTNRTGYSRLSAKVSKHIALTLEGLNECMQMWKKIDCILTYLKSRNSIVRCEIIDLAALL